LTLPAGVTDTLAALRDGFRLWPCGATVAAGPTTSRRPAHPRAPSSSPCGCGLAGGQKFVKRRAPDARTPLTDPHGWKFVAVDRVPNRLLIESQYLRDFGNGQKRSDSQIEWNEGQSRAILPV